MATSDRKLVVAALDVGTVYSGYAFSLRSDFDINPIQNIHTNTWTAENVGTSDKAPSAVLLNSDRSFHSFGYEAQDAFAGFSASEGDSDSEQEEYKDMFYFEKFKMQLYEESRIHRNMVIKDVFGKEMLAMDVFIMVIRYLKDSVFRKIQERNIPFKFSEIRWVLTVPAVWSNPAKQFMREAGIRAGIDGEDLVLAYEPEAVALFCRSMPPDQLSGTGNDVFTIGNKIMIADLGGGTADFTVQEVVEGKRLRSIFSVSGGPWGGEMVNKGFIKLLEDIIGVDELNEFRQKDMSDFFYLMRQFEMQKRKISLESTRVMMYIPPTVQEMFKKSVRPIELSDSLTQSSFRKSITTTKRGKMNIEHNEMLNMFEDVVENVVSHMKHLLAKPACRGVRTIIMAGNFSESPLVNQIIKREFAHLKVITPLAPGLTVLKGGVIFGHKPEIVNARYCAQTYGIAVNKDYDPSKHQGGVTFLSGGRTMCENCFETLLPIGEVVSTGTKQSIPVQSSHVDGDRKRWQNDVKEIEVFTSQERFPVFVTDPGCKRHAMITIQPPPGGWPDIVDGRVEMEVGGTEVIVRYVDRNGMTSSTSLDFMWYADDDSTRMCVDREEGKIFYSQ